MLGHTVGKRQNDVWNLGFYASKAQALNPYTPMLSRRPTFQHQFCCLTTVQPLAHPFPSSARLMGAAVLLADSRVPDSPRLCSWEFPCLLFPSRWLLCIIRKPTATPSPSFCKTSVMSACSCLEQREVGGSFPEPGVCWPGEEEGSLGGRHVGRMRELQM